MVPADGQMLAKKAGATTIMCSSFGNEIISWILEMAIEPFSMRAKDCHGHESV
jgi:hypothetical protein